MTGQAPLTTAWPAFRDWIDNTLTEFGMTAEQLLEAEAFVADIEAEASAATERERDALREALDGWYRWASSIQGDPAAFRQHLGVGGFDRFLNLIIEAERALAAQAGKDNV